MARPTQVAKPQLAAVRVEWFVVERSAARREPILEAGRSRDSKLWIIGSFGYVR